MPIDVAFFLILILAVFKGFSKGFILGIFSFLAFIIGLAAALKLSAAVAHYFENSTGSGARWLPILSFALVFIVVALLVNVGARIIKKVVSLALLGWADKVGGIIFYLLIYTVIFSVVLFLAEKSFLIKPETIAASSTYKYIAPWGPKLIDNLGKIIPVFKDLFVDLQSFFEKAGHRFAA